MATDSSGGGRAMSPGRKYAWIAMLSIGSGLPFGVFKEFLPVWLRAEGVSTESIGFVGGLAVAWSLKVFWSPLVDRFGSRRAWISGSLALCAASLWLASLSGIDSFVFLAVALGVFTVASATQDVAVNAFVVRAVVKGQEGPANSFGVTGYRLAMWLAGGPAVALAAWLAWESVLEVLAVVFLALAVVALFAPRSGVERSMTMSELFSGLARWFAGRGALVIALVVLLYKLPDAALGMMVRTFWVDAELSLETIGGLMTLLTLVATVAGASIGGLVVAKAGVLRGLLWLGLAQSLSNLAYSVADWTGRETSTVIAAAGVESFCAGLSTAALLAFVMRICEKERAAVEFALLTALFAATRELTGIFSGVGVATVGYGGWFAVTSLGALPGLALLFVPSVARRVGERPLHVSPGKAGP